MNRTATPDSPVPLPRVLTDMRRVFAGAGFEAYLVGGAVRDYLLGRRALDYDIATNAPPERVMRLFRRVVPTGIAHGTVTVLLGDARVEVTTFRSDGAYTDGRRPDAVSFGASLEADLSRRDFTMNAVAVSLESGEIIDPFGGREDIARRVIRTVGSPYARFSEDALRPIRAIRFAACLGFEIDPPTLDAIPLCSADIGRVSVERFRDEFIKLLGAPLPSPSLRLMEDCGILFRFVPCLAPCRGVMQADSRGLCRVDVLDHLYYSCDAAPAGNLPVRLAALFHDAGKPGTRGEETRQGASGEPFRAVRFCGHEASGAEITLEALTRLRFPRKTAQYAAHLAAEHTFRYESAWSDAAVRRFAARVGPEALDDVLALRRADAAGAAGGGARAGAPPCADGLDELKARAERLLAGKETALSLKDLAVNGSDLMRAGIPPGARMGAVLRGLYERVLDDPAENERGRLLEAARRLYREGGG